jgi:beta-lactamase superfamily II metal-dependent hydrolase
MANRKRKTSKVKTFFISLLALVIGVLVGFVLGSFFQTTLLEFEVVGNNNLNIGLDKEYVDEGVKCLYNGQDKTEFVEVEYYDSTGNKVSKIDTSKVNTYIVKYIYKEGKIETSITKVVNIVTMEDLEIHFMMLGNDATGDSIYIKAGETDILVDAGSRESSATAIKDYVDDFVTDGKLEYVIATHADKDHIAAFGGENGLLYSFEIETIIDFPLTNKTTKIYEKYRTAVNDLVKNGTNHYTALECYNNENGATRIIELAEGIEMEILYNYFYENNTDDENDYSVCFMLRRGDEQFLFTGDLEKNGEEHLVEMNELGEVYLYKAAHHGSKTSNTLGLLEEIKPEVVVIPCVAFTQEYTSNLDNIFPTKIAIDNFNAVGVKHLYVPAMLSDNEEGYEAANGNIVIYSNSNGTYVECSETNEDFYNFEIFKQYREWN